MWPFLLLAASAAGYALSIRARKNQERFARIGDEMDKQALQMQFQQEALASSEQAYYSSEKLRDVMATQRALFASRGQQAGQGSNLMIGQASHREHDREDRARQLSLSFRKHQFDSMQRLIDVNRVSRNSKRRSEDMVAGFNMLSFGGGSGLSIGLGNSAGSNRLPN